MNRGPLARGLGMFAIGACLAVVLAGCSLPVSIGPQATAIPTDLPPLQPTVTMPAATEAPPLAVEVTTAATEATAAAAAQQTSQCTVTARSNLRLRGGPSTNSPVVGSLASGQTVAATGRNQENTWAAVQAAEGQTAWASLQFLNCNPASDTLPVAPNP